MFESMQSHQKEQNSSGSGAVNDCCSNIRSYQSNADARKFAQAISHDDVNSRKVISKKSSNYEVLRSKQEYERSGTNPAFVAFHAG
ncbi:unnamed protein product [Calicophoron daubneyi]|uniref:Uncharacterized protein n=1 Tax=Calicophoron daubneyi TaxID=300641 RepID=A0AAV2SXM0_CALDB